MKYDRCDFSLYNYYIHDVDYKEKKLMLLCSYAETEKHIVCFTEVTHLEAKELLYGGIIKYMTAADRGRQNWYKIFYMSHSLCTILCANTFQNQKVKGAI